MMRKASLELIALVLILDLSQAEADPAPFKVIVNYLPLETPRAGDREGGADPVTG
jgi:hypothetical protein